MLVSCILSVEVVVGLVGMDRWRKDVGYLEKTLKAGLINVECIWWSIERRVVYVVQSIQGVFVQRGTAF